MENLFTFFNASVIPFWIILAFFYQSVFYKKLLANYLVPIVLAICYMVFIIWGMTENLGGEGGMGSLSALRIAFQNDKVLLAAWLHYLVFDLMMGIYINQQCLALQFPHWQRLLSLVFTLFFGPIGLLLFQLFSFFKKRK